VRTRLKFGERSFSCAGPRAWNSLPSSLQELTDTKTFKRKLKTFLFQQAYHWTYVVLFVSFLSLFYFFALCNPLVNFIVSGTLYELWTMNLQEWPRYYQDEPALHMSARKIVWFTSFFVQTQCRIDCTKQTTKLVGNNATTIYRAPKVVAMLGAGSLLSRYKLSKCQSHASDRCQIDVTLNKIQNYHFYYINLM